MARQQANGELARFVHHHHRRVLIFPFELATQDPHHDPGGHNTDQLLHLSEQLRQPDRQGPIVVIAIVSAPILFRQVDARFRQLAPKAPRQLDPSESDGNDGELHSLSAVNCSLT